MTPHEQPAVDRARIRVKAMGMFRDGRGNVLACPFRDPVDGREFNRLVGGSVEFGEHAREAFEREIREELGCGVVDVSAPRIIENVFTYAGRPGHEVVFVFEARLDDAAVYADGWDGVILDVPDVPVRWIPEAACRSGELTLYPDGCLG